MSDGGKGGQTEDYLLPLRGFLAGNGGGWLGRGRGIGRGEDWAGEGEGGGERGEEDWAGVGERAGGGKRIWQGKGEGEEAGKTTWQRHEVEEGEKETSSPLTPAQGVAGGRLLRPHGPQSAPPPSPVIPEGLP